MSTRARWGIVVLGVVALHLGCKREVRKGAETLEPAPPSAPSGPAPTRVVRPAPTAGQPLRCEDIRPPPRTEDAAPETIRLRPPDEGKKLVMEKVGVTVTFGRDDFLKTAQCLRLNKAIAYVEQTAGASEDIPVRDAFGLSYVAAALLDGGRASVKRMDESTSRASIVRDAWADDGCAGHCRSVGRLYRLSEDDSHFFLRITDRTTNDWEQGDSSPRPTGSR